MYNMELTLLRQNAWEYKNELIFTDVMENSNIYNSADLEYWLIVTTKKLSSDEGYIYVMMAFN